MRRPASTILAATILALSSAGCALYPGSSRPARLDDMREEEGWNLLASVPFVEQLSEQGCGAACLSMVLGHWGIAAPVESLEEECASPSEEGIRAADLRDAARRRGLSAFLIAGTMADIEHELARGRPVIVGLAKPAGREFTAHFEVVVGLNAGKGRIAVLDPAFGPMRDSLAGFEKEWKRTKGVMLVVFVPKSEKVSATRGEPTGGGP